MQAFKTLLLCMIAIATGVVVWEWLVRATGMYDVWHSSAYFTKGFPLMILISFLLGICVARRAWRWGLLVILPQPFLLLAKRLGAFWLVAVFFFVVLAVPCIAASCAGGVMRSYWERRAGAHPSGRQDRSAPEAGIVSIAIVGIFIPVFSTILGHYLGRGNSRMGLLFPLLLGMGGIFHIVVSAMPFFALAIFSSKRLRAARESGRALKAEWAGIWAALSLISLLAIFQEFFRFGLGGFNRVPLSAVLISLSPLASLLVFPLAYRGGQLLRNS